MSKFKIGDTVEITQSGGDFFQAGAKGVVVEVEGGYGGPMCLITFTEGEYTKDFGFSGYRGEWWVMEDKMKLVDMNKFKAGDKVRVVVHEVNREWVIDSLEGVETAIEYRNTKGSTNVVNYYTSSGYFVPEVSMELVEQVKEIKTMQEGYGLSLTREAMKESREIMQKHEGDGYAVKAWAVEVDGEISPWCTYPSRKEAREERNWHADRGAKAHVRKVEIRKVKGKV